MADRPSPGSAAARDQARRQARRDARGSRPGRTVDVPGGLRAAPAPPAEPATPWWRQGLHAVGLDDEFDALRAGWQRAGDEFAAGIDPAARAHVEQLQQVEDARRAAAALRAQQRWDASLPGQLLGPHPVRDALGWARDQAASLFEPSPEAQAAGAALRDTMEGEATKQGLGDQLSGPLAPIFRGVATAAPNFAVDTLTDDSPAGIAMNLDLPFPHALPGLAAALPPGFYSRIDRLAEGVGKHGVTPARLQKLTSADAGLVAEAGARKLDELIAGGGGAKTTQRTISKEALTRHLAENPPPSIKTTVLGEPEGRSTKYGTYTLPGGSNYRETLTRLGASPNPRLWALQHELDAAQEEMRRHFNHTTVDPLEGVPQHLIDRVDTLGAEVGRLEQAARDQPEYQSPHWDQPNVLLHTRANERTLPTGERGRFVEEVQSDWGQQGKARGYRPADYDQQFRAAVNRLDLANLRRAEYETAFSERYDREQPFVPRTYEQWLEDEILPGPYRGPAHEADNRRIFREDEARRRVAWRTTAMADALEADPAYQAHRQEVQDAYNALSTLRGQQGPPDMPFKESWPDLALKQQLLDVSHNHPDLSWLGFTTGQTQNERYQLANFVDKLEYDPEHQMLTGYKGGEESGNWAVTPEELDEYIGKEPADLLRQKIAQHAQAGEWERSQWSVEPDADYPGRFNIVDPNGEIMHGFGGEPEQFASQEDAQHYINEAIAAGPTEHPSLEGLDLQIGGRGMPAFYDELLPERLRKLLAPHGGTVERGAVPIEKTLHERTDGFTVLDRYGNSRGWWPTREEAQAYLTSPPPQMRDLVDESRGAHIAARPGVREVQQTLDEPAWIARLSPEVKARIRAGGFPLLSTVPFAVGAGALAADAASDDQQPGASPGWLGGGLSQLAGVAPITLGGHRPVGDLSRALKYLGEGRYALRAPILKRLGEVYNVGRDLPRKATWGGAEHPELVEAFAGDSDLGQLWARFFGSTSAGTGVPKNTQESVATLTHALDRPGEPFTPTEFAPDVNGRLRPRLALYGTTVTNAESKIPSLNMNLQGFDPNGPKTGAFAQFMYGLPRSPIDRHVLWALGSADDTLAAQHGNLKNFMLGQEGLRPRDLNEQKVYERVENALARGLQTLDPERKYNPLFGDFWEGVRAMKGEQYQGGPIDILRSRDLLGPGYLTDPDRLKHALEQTGSGLWIAK